jgi:hypothetical protein
MIYDALDFIRKELDDYLNSLRNEAEDEVVLGNIAFADPNIASTAVNFSVNDRVVVSLVNIEEEKTLKNTPQKISVGGGVYNYQEPPIFLNLYVLFRANHSTYGKSLRYVGDVILFFQRKHTFKDVDYPQLMPFNIERLIFDIHTLSFEQMNHLWAVLGGKYIPSVLYKVRLLQMQNAEPVPVRKIEEIEQRTNVIFNNQC